MDGGYARNSKPTDPELINPELNMCLTGHGNIDVPLIELKTTMWHPLSAKFIEFASFQLYSVFFISSI
jgi:hypothetical protein